MTTPAPPLICVSANSRQPDDRRRLPLYATADRYVRSLLKMVDCIPLMMPPVGAAVFAVRRGRVRDLASSHAAPPHEESVPVAHHGGDVELGAGRIGHLFAHEITCPVSDNHRSHASCCGTKSLAAPGTLYS